MTTVLPTRSIAAWMAVVLCVLSVAWPAFAQIPGYNQLFAPQAEEPTPAETPSVPVASPEFDPATGPTVEDYARVAASVPDPMLDATRQGVEVFRARLKATVRRLPEAFEDIRIALTEASPTGRPSYFLGVAIFAGLLIVIGRAFTVLFNVYYARRMMIAMQRTEREGYLGKLPVLAYRVVMTMVAVAITLGIAVAIGLVFYQEHEASMVTTIIVFGTYFLVLMVDTIWRMALAPYLSEYRLPHLDDISARSIYRWLSIVSAFGLISMAFCYWIQALGLAEEVHTAITIVLSLITVVGLIALIRVHRHAITGILLGGRPKDEVSWLALAASTLWSPVIIVYLIVTWGDLAFRMIMGLEQAPFRLAVPYLIFIVGMIVYALSTYIIERVFVRAREISTINAELDAERKREEAAANEALKARIMGQAGDAADVDGDGDDEGGTAAADEEAKKIRPPRPGMRTLEDLARRAASLFAVGAVAYALIRYWGGPGVFETNTALGIVEDVIDILFIGYIVFHAVRIWIDGKIAEEVGEEDDGPADGEGGGAGATRLATILPLFRNFLLIMIGVSIALLIAVEFGVNVAPLFAGAGIVGLAIGFGSQTLVRDILSGAFFLADDAFRKGEYIDVGDVKGTVEKISLRSFQLRHHLGMLHTIPFGEITHLTNFSRDWVMMKLPLRLTYDTDVERVRKLIKKLGLRLAEDPEIGDKFIQPLKSQGVIQMDDSAMIVRMKFMTKPGEQWVLRKRIFAEIRELFNAEGIKFAHREVTVRIPDIEKKELTTEQQQAIGAAARRVGDAEREDMLAKT